MKRGAGAGYFWGNVGRLPQWRLMRVARDVVTKSDWPRAAMERAGCMRSWFDKLTTNGRMNF